MSKDHLPRFYLDTNTGPRVGASPTQTQGPLVSDYAYNPQPGSQEAAIWANVRALRAQREQAIAEWMLNESRRIQAVQAGLLPHSGYHFVEVDGRPYEVMDEPPGL